MAATRRVVVVVVPTEPHQQKWYLARVGLSQEGLKRSPVRHRSRVEESGDLLRVPSGFQASRLWVLLYQLYQELEAMVRCEHFLHRLSSQTSAASQ